MMQPAQLGTGTPVDELSTASASTQQLSDEPDWQLDSAPMRIGLWIALLLSLAIFAHFAVKVIKRLSGEYSALREELQRHFGDRDTDGNRGPSPGYSFALASRGPLHSLDAELDSAESRWRHVSVAFPLLVSRHAKDADVILVSVEYTPVPAVAAMQSLAGQLIKNHFLAQGQRVLEPAWISDLGPDFDALRHPELAIANPTFYTFPFFLTWQRRHQWGVLPYATHTRLGVVVRSDHPRIAELRSIQSEYQENLNRVKVEGSPFWVSDPRFAGWLNLILDSAGDRPSYSCSTCLPEQFSAEHKTDTVFSVGAYLHKELLPLTCAVLGDSKAAATLSDKVQLIDVSRLSESGLLRAPAEDWSPKSAVVVDLAVATETLGKGLELLKLPHCVYVPIGIGYSVLGWPALAADSDWTRDMLRDVGQSLKPATNELSAVGIELDERLWAQTLAKGQ